MAVRFSEHPCKKSAKGRPCIGKFQRTQIIGDSNRRTIYRCRRCLEVEVITEKASNFECPTSPDGNHKWRWVENVAFKQHHRYQEKTDKEVCPHCSCEQLRSYQSLIAYNPHRN